MIRHHETSANAKTTEVGTPAPHEETAPKEEDAGNRPQLVRIHNTGFHEVDDNDKDEPIVCIDSLDANANALDNVNLNDDAVKDDPTPPTVPSENTTPRTLSLSSFTHVIPSIPWSPSASDLASKSVPSLSTPPQFPTPVSAQPSQLTRKLTSPFSWLSRGSVQKEALPSSLPFTHASVRRNTASSIATMASNPEVMSSKLDDDGGNLKDRSYYSSLKDRFKMIRLREEGGISSLPDEQKNDPAEAEPNESGCQTAVATKPIQFGIPPNSMNDVSHFPAVPNMSLAPGTVSGVTAGPPSVGDVGVDWDFWQAVIYEGPAAVARSSSEELNRAIATGIPSAIRGVIWQVLAQSQNEKLETVYHELVARGTGHEKDYLRYGRNSIGKGGVASGSSSVHSGDAGSGSGVGSICSVGSGGVVSPSLSLEKGKDTTEKGAERKNVVKVDMAALNKLERAIRRDLGARTSYSKFAAAQGMQESLFGVCKAYALYDESVGYAQGMNFLIMPLLFNMTEEEAFCLLVRLMNHYHLRDLFVQDMPGLHKNLYLFERLLEDLEPALHCHLRRRGISPHLYATQWFLTLFAYRFPLQLVLRIYDLILSEGLSAILKFGVVLMQKNATSLLTMSDMSQLTTFLKERLFDVYIDASPSAGSILENGFFGSSSSSLDKEVYRADQFVRDACKIKLTREAIMAYTAEWEEKTQAEREREAELEDLRMTNASLTIQLRKFEEHVEVVDREQAALATELVRHKVENEELRDENESLKGQVRELKIVIEKQPEELELEWKSERDKLTTQNAHVHEESLRLMKEMAELEEELVETKMRHAELNSQHEALSRKWADLKRQFT